MKEPGEARLHGSAAVLVQITSCTHESVLSFGGNPIGWDWATSFRMPINSRTADLTQGVELVESWGRAELRSSKALLQLGYPLLPDCSHHLDPSSFVTDEVRGTGGACSILENALQRIMRIHGGGEAWPIKSKLLFWLSLMRGSFLPSLDVD